MRFSLRIVFVFFVLASIVGAIASWTGLLAAPVVMVAAAVCAAVAVRLSGSQQRLATAGLTAVAAAIVVALVVPAMLEPLAIFVTKPVPPWRATAIPPPDSLARADEQLLLLVLAVLSALVVWLVGVCVKASKTTGRQHSTAAANSFLWIGLAALGASAGFAVLEWVIYSLTRHVADPPVEPAQFIVDLVPGAIVAVPYLIAWQVVRWRNSGRERDRSETMSSKFVPDGFGNYAKALGAELADTVAHIEQQMVHASPEDQLHLERLIEAHRLAMRDRLRESRGAL